MGRRLKILIIDDDRDLADSIVELLELHGYQATAAYGGDEGVRKFREQNFDVAIVDVRMPGKTGIECVADISRLDSHARILMMTAFRDEAVLQELERSDEVQVLNKPLDTGYLFEILDGIGHAGIVLLVDDDIDVCASLEKFLSDRGFRVFVARTGGEAMNVALAEAVEILLLDLRLPDINGAEIYFRLRDQGRDLPTIVITGYEVEEADAIARLREAHGAVCFTKPIDPNALGDAVELMIKSNKDNLSTG